MDQPNDILDIDDARNEAPERIDAFLEDAHDNKVRSDAVINTIGFRKGDTFYWDSPEFDTGRGIMEPETFGLQRILQTNQFNTGLSVGPVTARPGDPAFERPADIDEFIPGCYERLFRDWLSGNLVPVREESEYIRVDTEEVVEP